MNTSYENQTDMAFFDIKDAKDLYKKLEYDFNKLSYGSLNSYDYMNYIVTANHLKEWIENDYNIASNIKSKARGILDKDKNKEYSTIKSLCNRGKHFYKDDYHNIKYRMGIFEDVDCNNIDFNHFGQSYKAECDGNIVSLYNICKIVFEQYKEILEN